MVHTDDSTFTPNYYFKMLTKMLANPRVVFAGISEEVEWKRPLFFLLISSLFFTGATLLHNLPEKLFLMGAVFLINAIGMTFIAAGSGYLVMRAVMGRRVGFKRFFSIYAFSTGVTLLAAWIPFFILLTEPWKWWLIGKGLVSGLGFKLNQAFIIIGVSVAIMIFFFWLVSSMLLPHA